MRLMKRINRFNRNLISGLIALAVIIVLSAVIVRMLSGSETLADYAKEHPVEQVKPEIEAIKEDPLPEIPTHEAVKTVEADETVETVNLLPGDEYYGTDECVIYEEGFYYEPIPQIIRDKMKGVSYPLDIDENKVCFDDLKYVRLLYNDFSGETAEGEMVCNKAIAQDVVEIFAELYRQGYSIESIRLIDDFDADDTRSMEADNTSCFCYRVVDGTTHLSNHAYGRAIDLNPFYNPYVVFKKGEDDYISPPGSEIYADRSTDFPYKIDENDLAYRLFMEHGFSWGGNWNSSKDYQHFEKKD